MKHNIFEIRQQAEELLKEAIGIWRQSSLNDQLEGIENDPVFSLILTALAYQLNDIDYDIARLKQDVLDEFAQQLVPYDISNAIPATAVISTNLQEGIKEVNIDDNQKFVLNGTSYPFIPLFKTKVMGAEIDSIVRLDARRWKMNLHFKTPITDLSGFSFAITNTHFKNLKITIGGKLVPLVKPWHYADLPLCTSFSLDTILYKQAPTFNAANIWIDLFARQDARIFTIKKHAPKTFINYETDNIDMILEFQGVAEDFVFDKQSIALNTIVLVNAIPHSVNLSSANPIVRIVGSQASQEANREQFMHLTRPSEDQTYANATVDVRTVAADRFNQGRLQKMLNSLIDKFDTDYYAFQGVQNKTKEVLIQQLRDGLQRLQNACAADTIDNNIAGTYLMLRHEEIAANKNISLKVNYLTTQGANVNGSLTQQSSFSLPMGLTSQTIQQILPPVPGSDEVMDKKKQNSMARYYFVTNDRIVTPADIKIFCYNELMNRYGISPDMIAAINIRHLLQEDRANFGYETWVEIIIINSPFIKRHFTEKITQAELFIQKMIEVRSCSIYPLQVNIRIEEEEDNII